MGFAILPAPPDGSKKAARGVCCGVPSRFYRLPLEEIAYVRAIVDGYDGLAVVRSLDPGRGEVEWIVAEGREAEATALAERLRNEASLQEIPRPDDWPDLSGKFPAITH